MSESIKTILYASDLGKHTRPAFRMALNLAKVHNAKIVFLYVVEPLSPMAASAVSIYFPADTLEEMTQQSMDEISDKVHERIKTFCEEELRGEELPSGQPEPHIIEGLPAASIIKTAEKLNADLIVMGSHSHGPLDRLLLGSVANKVVNRSTKPVLLVPIKSG